MKLTSVEIHAQNSSDVVVLSYRDPRGLNQYNVKSILGLDATAILPTSYGVSGTSKFYNLSLDKRDIILKLGLNPDFSINQSYSDLRDALYKFIATSRTGQVQLQFKNGIDIIAVISGFVSKFEAPQFDQLQEVLITVSCTEPMLKGFTPINVVVAGLNPANTVISDTKSTAPHGFTFDMGITANIVSLMIKDPSDDTWGFEIVPVGGFLIGDVLHFSNENGKYLYLTRATVPIYLADVVTPGSIWPFIFPGDNVLSCTHPTGVVWNAISYYPTYWGV